MKKIMKTKVLVTTLSLGLTAGIALGAEDTPAASQARRWVA